MCLKGSAKKPAKMPEKMKYIQYDIKLQDWDGHMARLVSPVPSVHYNIKLELETMLRVSKDSRVHATPLHARSDIWP